MYLEFEDFLKYAEQELGINKIKDIEAIHLLKNILKTKVTADVS